MPDSNSKSFGTKSPRKAHLVKPAGGVGGEVYDLRKDLREAFRTHESRDAADEFPELDWVDGGFAAAAGGDLVLKGRFLLQGQSFAELTLFTGTSELIFTALKPGQDGNDYTIEIQDTGSLTVTLTGNALVVTIDLGTTTADAIATAINANGADTDGIIRCNGGGVGVAQAVTAATNLVGGTGEGWECRISGTECLPANTTGANGAAAIAEGVCTVTVPDLTALGDARAAGDPASLHILTDAVRTQALSGLLA
jgi:hypothetical protein